MSGRSTKSRIGAVMGLSLLAASPVVAQQAQESPPINQGNSLTPTQPELQELPSVSDLADRLLPAVVEITIESKGSSSSAPSLPDLPGGNDENSPFREFFDEFLKRQQG